MTSDEFGEMFEGDFADKCGDKFPLISIGGTSNTVKHTHTGSNDPHRRERISNSLSPTNPKKLAENIVFGFQQGKFNFRFHWGFLI